MWILWGQRKIVKEFANTKDQFAKKSQITILKPFYGFEFGVYLSNCELQIANFHGIVTYILPISPSIRYTPHATRRYETHISAEKEEAGKDAWISQAVCHHERAGASETPAQKGTSTACPVSVFKMPRRYSLTHADFIRAERARFRRERGMLFMLSFGTLPGQKPTELKAACVVSKKTAPHAVGRNLIKRRWRNAMRQCVSAAPAPSVLIFYAMRPAQGASYADVKNDVARLVARAGVKLRTS